MKIVSIFHECKFIIFINLRSWIERVRVTTSQAIGVQWVSLVNLESTSQLYDIFLQLKLQVATFVVTNQPKFDISFNFISNKSTNLVRTL